MPKTSQPDPGAADMAVPPFRASGYGSGLFRGMRDCAFRLCAERADGLTVLTVGDQRNRGRLVPVIPGFVFVTFVGVFDADPEAPDRGEWRILDRAGCNDPAMAEAQHGAAVRRWADRTPSPQEKLD